MKRVMAFLLALSVCLVALSACSNSSQEDVRADATDSSDVTDVNQTETETTDETIPAIMNVELDQTQLQGKCDISEGNAYILEISNYNEAMAFGWAIVIDVGEDFDASSITYLNGSNKYLEEKDISMSCRLEGNQLIVVPDGWCYAENVMSFTDENTAATNENAAIDVNDKLYLLITSDKLSEEITFTANLYGYDSESGIYEMDTDSDTLQRATGKVVLQYCNGNFSEGLCWMEIEYEDTDERKNAIIDKAGNVVAEFDTDVFSSFGDFYNGVSLVNTEDGLFQYINTQGEVVFSSDDAEYGSLIQGMFDGGYMFVRKTESNLTSSATYYAVINCYKEFVIDWTEYSGWDLFNYYGGGVFIFMDGYSDQKSVSCFWYNAEEGTWGHINKYEGDWDGVHARSFLTQPGLVAETSDGWIMVEEDNKVNTDLIAISTKDGIAHDLNSKWDYAMSGVYGDGVYVLVALDYSDNVSALAYFDTNTGSIVTMDYEYANLIEDPESLFVDVRNSSFVEVGYWPAFNMPSIVNSSVTKTINSQSHLCTLQYSEGAMLLQLHGKDGVDYYTLIDKQGNSIVEPTPGEAIGMIGKGRFAVRVDGVYHILNEKGEEIFTNLTAKDSEYQAIDSAGEFHDGLAQFRVHCKTGYFDTIFVDTDGNVVFWLGETIVREITEVGA